MVILYKDNAIGGAGIIQSSYMKTKPANKRADMAMYGNQAESDIINLLKGLGSLHMQKMIVDIDNYNSRLDKLNDYVRV